jgi:hypothetical protein
MLLVEAAGPVNGIEPGSNLDGAGCGKARVV